MLQYDRSHFQGSGLRPPGSAHLFLLSAGVALEVDEEVSCTVVFVSMPFFCCSQGLARDSHAKARHTLPTVRGRHVKLVKPIIEPSLECFRAAQNTANSKSVVRQLLSAA